MRGARLSPNFPHALAPQTLAPQGSEHARSDRVSIEMSRLDHDVRAVLVLEDVGQSQGADLEAAVQKAIAGEEMQNERPEAALRPFLDRHQHFVFVREASDQIFV